MQVQKDQTQSTRPAGSLDSAQTKAVVSKSEGLVKEALRHSSKRPRSVSHVAAANSRFAHFRPFNQHQGSTQDEAGKAKSSHNANTLSQAAGRSIPAGNSQSQKEAGPNLYTRINRGDSTCQLLQNYLQSFDYL